MPEDLSSPRSLPLICVGDLRQLLRVPLRSQGHCGFGTQDPSPLRGTLGSSLRSPAEGVGGEGLGLSAAPPSRRRPWFRACPVGHQFENKPFPLHHLPEPPPLSLLSLPRGDSSANPVASPRIQTKEGKGRGSPCPHRRPPRWPFLGFPMRRQPDSQQPPQPQPWVLPPSALRDLH